MNHKESLTEQEQTRKKQNIQVILFININNRAFSLDVMLSSNMAASIVLNRNQYSFMQASFYTIVRNGLSMNFSIHGSSTDGHIGGQHDVSENAQLPDHCSCFHMADNTQNDNRPYSNCLTI